MRIPNVLVGFAALGLTAGCSGKNYYITGNDHTDAYLVGDTASFVAQELFDQFLDEHGGELPSNQAPDLYGWVSNSPAVADFIAPGRIVTKAPGSATLKVRSPHTSASFTIFVLPPNASVRSTVHQLTMYIGDSVSLRADIMDSTGSVMTEFTLGPRIWYYNPGFNAPGTGSGTVVTLAPTSTEFRIKAVNPGTAAAYPNLSLYRRHTLTDTVSITVRAR